MKEKKKYCVLEKAFVLQLKKQVLYFGTHYNKKNYMKNKNIHKTCKTSNFNLRRIPE